MKLIKKIKCSIVNFNNFKIKKKIIFIKLNKIINRNSLFIKYNKVRNLIKLDNNLKCKLL